MVDHARISDTMFKMALHLASHKSICVGVSGGSDSNIIVHILATYFRDYLPKIHFVFQNTGLEYRATLRHLDYMEQRYHIHIDRIRGESVVSVVRREGVPVLSKRFSLVVKYAQKESPWALVKMGRLPPDGKNYPISGAQKALAAYLVDNGIPVSSMCCDLSKKKPHKDYVKRVGADLDITGERQAEHGLRAVSHKSCFEDGRKDGINKFMPLFFWDDDTKAWYKRTHKIRYSDCYEIWGMRRTGCVGCPFNSRVGEDLRLIQRYEPQMYKACMAVFGESYRLMDKFGVHRHKILDRDKEAVC